MLKKTFEEFLNEVNEIHSGNIDVSHFSYNGHHSKSTCKCNICNHVWETTPSVLLRGFKCPNCSAIKKSIKCRWSVQTFIEMAKNKHGERYNYGSVEYVNMRTKVCMICKEHGEFWQLPRDHLQGHGCPRCNDSRLEKEIELFLTNNNIECVPQKRFGWLGLQSLDFYIPSINLAIECQGKQHFGLGGWSDEYDFNKQFERDNLKKELCEQNGVKLIYYIEKKYEKYMTENNYIIDTEDIKKYIKNI